MVEKDKNTGCRLQNDKVLEFVFAGNSSFTVKNSSTGNHFTYHVRAAKKTIKPLFFVSVKPRKFIGTIFDKNTFSYSKKSELPIDSPEVKGFAFVFYHLLSGTLPDKVEIWHNGKCARCGRTLTQPSSIISGIGPECLKKASRGDSMNNSRRKRQMHSQY